MGGFRRNCLLNPLTSIRAAQASNNSFFLSHSSAKHQPLSTATVTSCDCMTVKASYHRYVYEYDIFVNAEE